ncbi:DNA (cytosine-5-)-methyltransferase, partial [mine drainage metagenome]
FKTAESEGRVWHPTQKPVSLGQYLVRTFTRPGEVVLDNTFGSGSFLVAAVREGRNFIGIEKNDEMRQFKKHPTNYLTVATERIRESVGSIRPETKTHLLPFNVLAS